MAHALPPIGNFGFTLERVKNAEIAKIPSDMTILLEPVLRSTDNPTCSEEFGDYSFAIEGKSVPIDHAHCLYASLTQVLPEFHESNSVGIFGISGKVIDVTSNSSERMRSKRISINDESRLRIRLPLTHSRLAYKLAGKTLQIGHDRIYLHIPELELLFPSSAIEARIVSIKGHQDISTFLPTVERQLEGMDVNGNVRVLTKSNGQPLCRTIRIHQRKVVGFGVRIDGLNDRDSLSIQQQGIGGKWKFGCGLFAPC